MNADSLAILHSAICQRGMVGRADFSTSHYLIPSGWSWNITTLGRHHSRTHNERRSSYGDAAKYLAVRPGCHGITCSGGRCPVTQRSPFCISEWGLEYILGSSLPPTTGYKFAIFRFEH